MEEFKIQTTYVSPKIAALTKGWWATLEGYKMGDPIGRGETRASAVYDLMQWLEEKSA